ncbi:MAG TPA: ABC transporter substrate-binding protein [Xanthobacteraceae bacterium]|jgi:ABC-type nitrate/sulfonate/bicarbonate transport system substrate-binding protein
MSAARDGKSAAIAALIGLAVAMGSTAPMKAAEGDLKLVRATLSRSLSAPFIWGFNPIGQKYGLRAQVVDAMTNADQQRNIQTGAVEVGSVGYQTAAVMAEQNVGNVKIIAGMYVGGQNLIMRKGVELKSWKDIEGKKIGRPPGSYAAILFTLAAEINKVDLSKVNLVNITPAGAPELAALKNGDLDGFVMWSPVIDRAVIEDYGYYPECCDIGGTKEFGAGNQLLAANAEFLKDRKTAVTFLKAYVEAMAYYRQNPDKTLALAAQYTGGAPAVLSESIRHSAWTYRVNIQNAVNVARQGPKFGFTRADLSSKVPGYFDLSYLAEATGEPIERLGTYGN